MNKLDMSKMKIVGVLLFPFKNKVVVRITRATDYFDYTQLSKEYSMSYNSKIYDNFFLWYSELQKLNGLKISRELKRMNNAS
jgi:hypothetical protein